MPKPQSLALNVEAIRAKMLERIRLPDDLLNKAIETTRQQLEATKTMYFSHKGEVIDKRIVEDNAARSAAADQVYSLAGMYAREKDNVEKTPTVAVEVDSTTGVIRLVVGDTSTNVLPTNVHNYSISNTSDSSGDFEQLPLKLEAQPVVRTISDKEKRDLQDRAAWRVISDVIVDD